MILMFTEFGESNNLNITKSCNQLYHFLRNVKATEQFLYKMSLNIHSGGYGILKNVEIIGI